jgi:DNA primase
MAIQDELYSIVVQYLDRVKRSGSDEIMAICPFHRKPDGSPERTGSFAMSLTTGLFFCHSCKAKGNLRHFFKTLGVSTHALRYQYGELIQAVSQIALPKINHTQSHAPTNSEPLPESFLGLFDYCPIDLLNEGFTEETLQTFDIGFDARHMRITFPIRDLTGKLVGISGRTVTDHPRRYKIYDQEYTEWGLPPRKIQMGDIIWNADKVYPEVYFGTNVPLIIVEGFKACMWLHQMGITNTVALLGSYLKQGQQWLLEHLGGVVYVMMDNDDAGQTGARYVGATLAKSLKVNMVTFDPTRKQPTDLTKEEIEQALVQAEDYYLSAIKKGRADGIR